MPKKTLWSVQSTEDPAPLTPTMLDFTDYTDADLKLLSDAAIREIEARKVLRDAPLAAEATARSYQEAVVRNVPAGETVDWTQPRGAHDAYPKGWRVKHGGKIWWSTIPANVWEPGTTGWTEEREDGGYPFWIQPMGAHDAYAIDKIVEHNGQLWRNTSANNVWEPGVYGWEAYDPNPPVMPEFVFTPELAVDWDASLIYPMTAFVTYEGVTYQSAIDNNADTPGVTESWVAQVDEEPEPEPEPTGPEYGTSPETAVVWVDGTEGYPAGAYVTHAENIWVSDIDFNIDEPGEGENWTQYLAPDPEPQTYPEWVQPTGGHNAYKIGDRVMFQGQAYESKIDGNTWSPTAYPPGMDGSVVAWLLGGGFVIILIVWGILMYKDSRKSRAQLLKAKVPWAVEGEKWERKLKDQDN